MDELLNGTIQNDIIYVDSIIEDTICNRDIMECNNGNARNKVFHGIIRSNMLTGIEKIMDLHTSGSKQGAAIFGDYLFQCVNKLNPIDIYYLGTKEFIAHIEMPSINDFHCNEASFSNEYYNFTDPFPILYVSQGAPKSIVGIRIYKENDSFRGRIIQTIQLPQNSEGNRLSWPNVVYSQDDGFFYIYSEFGKTEGQFSRFKKPIIADSIVSVKDNEIEKLFSIDYTLKNSQGGHVKNNILYFVQGIPNMQETYFRMVDLERKIIKSIKLKKQRFYEEPEGLDFYDNRLVCTTQNGHVYYFKLLE